PPSRSCGSRRGSITHQCEALTLTPPTSSRLQPPSTSPCESGHCQTGGCCEACGCRLISTTSGRVIPWQCRLTGRPSRVEAGQGTTLTTIFFCLTALPAH